MIYPVEEPESSQHPRHQKMLMRAFLELAGSEDCQVLFSTHTPMLAGLARVESLRHVRRKEDGAREVLSAMNASQFATIDPDENIKSWLRDIARLIPNDQASIPSVPVPAVSYRSE